MSGPVMLGPLQRPVLTALAAAPDGLTVAALADILKVERTKIDQSMGTLSDRCLVRVAGYQKRPGKAAKVWAASTAGLTALAAAGEGSC